MKKKKSIRAIFMKNLGYEVFSRNTTKWMLTVSEHINSVFGSRKKGIPQGILVELSGKRHSGKTLFTMLMLALAQKVFGAMGCWVDTEESWDPVFARKLGVNTKRVYHVFPKLGKFDKEDRVGRKSKTGTKLPSRRRLQGCEELFAEAEEWMEYTKTKHPDRPLFIVVDSVAGMIPKMALKKGSDEHNMRINEERAQFLSRVLPKWVSLISAYDGWLFFLNQLRMKPGVMFGDPEYSPGGGALEHYSHVRVRMGRKFGSKGKIWKNGKMIGLVSAMKNIKNKAGGGSVEGDTCEVQIFHRSNRPPEKMLTGGILKEKIK